MTREEAIKMYETNWWEGLPPTAVVAFQLFEDKLCIPFGTFHGLVEKALERPVFSHEFAYADKPGGLRDEFLKNTPRRSLKEIMDLIPEEKRIVVVTE